uniref:Putative secreted protein n=1 Tax=Amblyomma triste TaxID=251400 RepID=A0A023FZL8_AMBTT
MLALTFFIMRCPRLYLASRFHLNGAHYSCTQEKKKDHLSSSKRSFNFHPTSCIEPVRGSYHPFVMF